MGRRNRPSQGKKDDKKGIEPTVLVALIGAISAIVIALINSQTIVGWVLRSTATPTLTTSSPTPILTDTFTPVVVVPASTNTPEMRTTLPPSEVSVPSPSPTETPSVVIGMHVRLYADKTTGKVPLRVKLDARESFLQAPGGEIYGCKSGACNYTWEVYTGGQRIGKAVENSTGTFQYTFGKKGDYFITVVVCRGGGSSDCNGSGTQIIAK